MLILNALLIRFVMQQKGMWVREYCYRKLSRFLYKYLYKLWFLTPVNSKGKICFCLTAVPGVNTDEEDSIAARNIQEAVSGSAEKRTPKENRHQNFNDLPDNVNDTHKQEKNIIAAFFDLNQSPALDKNLRLRSSPPEVFL